VSNFFPVLEQLLTSDAITGNPHFMVLIAKIFYMSIQIEISPYLLQAQKTAPWI